MSVSDGDMSDEEAPLPSFSREKEELYSRGLLWETLELKGTLWCKA